MLKGGGSECFFSTPTLTQFEYVADVVQADSHQILVTSRLYGDLGFEIAYIDGKFQILERPYTQSTLNSDQVSP